MRQTDLSSTQRMALMVTNSGAVLANDQFLSGVGVPGLVSVIVPCYNRADIVGETIDSVLGQSYSNTEIIVVDDGSTDHTRAVVAAYDDPRVRYFYKENGWLSSARNAGLTVARGEFIAFLDSDDVWVPWKLAVQMEVFRRYSSAGLVWTDMSAFEKAGSIIAERYIRDYYSAYSLVSLEKRNEPAGSVGELHSEVPVDFSNSPFYVMNIFHEMFSGNLVHPSTAIVRRDRLQLSGPFEPEVTGAGAEDYHFYFRICAHGDVAFLDAPTTLYRVHASQLSSRNRLHEARGNLKVLTHWLDRRPETLPAPVAQRSLASSHAWLGAEELNSGDARSAARHFWQSLRLKRQGSTLWLLMVSLLPWWVVDGLRVIKRGLRSRKAHPVTGIVLLFLDDGNFIFELVNTVQLALNTTG